MRPSPIPQVLPDIVVIPFWIHESVNRNNFTIEECLNYETLKSILSAEDLAGFLNAQGLLPVLTGTEDNMLTSNALRGLWERNIPLDRQDVMADLNELDSKLRHVIGALQDTMTRLFDPNTKLERYEEPFKLFSLANKVTGLVIYPGYFTSAGELQLQSKLIEAVLQAFIMYSSYEEAAATPLFLRHLELLDGGYAD